MISPGAFRWLAAVTAIFAYLQITLGGLVRVSGSGLGCRDWPLCDGRPYPPPDVHSVIEYAHRLAGTVTGFLILATVVGAWLVFRRQLRVPLLATAALAAVLVEGVLGAIVVYRELQGALVLAHLAVALVILGLLVAVAVVVQPAAGAASRPAGTYLAAAVAATYAILLTGSGVVAAGADDACRSWPSCGSGVAAPVDGLQAISLVHRLMVAIGGLFVIYVLSLNVRGAPSIRSVAAALTLAALALQVAVGALTAVGGETPLFNGLHLALATAVWSGVVLVAACALRAAPGLDPEPRLALKGHTA